MRYHVYIDDLIASKDAVFFFLFPIKYFIIEPATATKAIHIEA